MTTAEGTLWVYKDARRVGELSCTHNGTVVFRYDSSVWGDPTAAVSLRMPVRREQYDRLDALSCFENLLPEGDIRGLIAAETKHDERDVVGLLGVVGGECAGALRLWPAGEEPPALDTYTPCAVGDLRAALGMANRGAAGSAVAHRTSRTSMSGAQDKIVLYRRPAIGGDVSAPPTYSLPLAGSATTVLVKRDRGAFPGLVQNEIVAMTLMEASGVPTAARAVCALDRSVYETVRFDRVLQSDGSVVRLHAEDGCQVTGRSSVAKYATTTGGPRLADFVHVLDRHGVDSNTDIEILLRWAVANMCIGNHDAHAKNISFLHTSEDLRVRLAPAYDVVCTVVYENIEKRFALQFGGAPSSAALNARCLKKVARELKIGPSLAARVVAEVADRIMAALPTATALARETAGEHPILEEMTIAIAAETAVVRSALLG